MTGIYRIKNEITGMAYYGQAVDYEKRRKQHIAALNGGYHCNQYLLRSWVKYGENAFTFTFVESCPVDKLDELEIKYIAEGRTLAPNGYNLTAGGDGVNGYKASPEELLRYSERSRQVWQRDGYRDKMSDLHKGHKTSEETRRKMSATRKGKLGPHPKKVLCIETGEVYGALRHVSIEGKAVNASNISRACDQGIRAYGYHWKYVDDP